MWKVATVAAAIFVLAACDTESAIRRQQQEQLKQAQDEVDAVAQIDDAKCRNYGQPGSNAYVQCRASLKSDRLNAPGSPKP